MPELSIIIPVHNRSSAVARAIGSVQQQTFKDFEIIVVDDGSDDNGATIFAVRTLAARDPRIKLIESTPNKGPSYARNLGIRAAQGNYIAMFDSDDICLPHKMATQLAALKKYPASDMVLCISDYDLVSMQTGAVMRKAVPNDPRSELLNGNFGFCCPSSVMASRETYAKIGSFDEALRCQEDTDWFLRFLYLGGRFERISEVLWRYAWQPKTYAHQWDSLERFARKNTPAIKELLNWRGQRKFSFNNCITKIYYNYLSRQYKKAVFELLKTGILYPVHTSRFASRTIIKRIRLQTKLFRKISGAAQLQPSA